MKARVARRRWLSALLACCLLSAGLAGAAISATAGSAPATAPDASPDLREAAVADVGQQQVDADRTRIRIDLRADGDANWTVELWTRLSDETDREAFRSLEADIAADSDAFVADFRGRMNGSLDAAETTTGREMALSRMTVETRTEAVPASYGVVAYRFRWQNFSAVDGDRIEAGAAIDGLLLEASTRLTVTWPDAYDDRSIEPAPDERSDRAAIWLGSQTIFVSGEPRVTLDSGGEAGGNLLPTMALGVLGLLVLLALAWLGRSGRLRLPDLGREPRPTKAAGADAPRGDTASGGGTDLAASEDSGDGRSTASGGSEADAEGAATAPSGGGEAADADVDADGSADADADETTEELPPELLSNEERVLRLLEQRGGRLKQQQVVSELDWTEAKTSQVVTAMREDEQIEVFRIGRENVLALPGEADL